jgi:coenzyme PQQ precursor peptide PqqA
MKWERPSAIDLRFGMEITMYIANRSGAEQRRNFVLEQP